MDTATEAAAPVGREPEPLAYSIKDASRVSSLSRSRLYQLITEQKLEIRKVGRRTLIPAESLRRLVA